MAARYWVGGTASWDATAGTKWALTSGGAGGQAAPTNADDVFFDAASGAVTATIAASSVCLSLNTTGFTGTLAGSSALAISGNLTLGAGATHSYNGTLTFNATTAKTITSNGRSLACPVTFDGVGGTWQLQDNFTTTNAGTASITLTNGTIDLNNLTMTTAGRITWNNSNVRSILFGTGKMVTSFNNGTILSGGAMTNFTYTGSGIIECSYSGSTGTRTVNCFGPESNALNIRVSAGTDTFSLANGCSYKSVDFTGFAGTWSNQPDTIYGDLTIATGMTVGSGTGAITFGATSGSKTITTNGKTLDFPLTFNGLGGTFTFADALTQGSTRAFTLTAGIVKLKSGVTSTVGALATTTAAAKTLQSSTAGSQATLSQASGTVSASNLTIKDIRAQGGATFNAFVSNGNVNAGGNTGWNFGTIPIGAGRAMHIALGITL